MTERHRLYRRWRSVALLLLIMAGLVSQWPERGLWYDETVNAYFAGQSWSAIWDWCTQIDNQVPLHFALLKLWGSAAGTGEFALRVFSALCAILSAAGLIALGQRIGGSWAGWLAAAAFALSQGFLYAAFEVRPYALALALLAWSNVILWMLWDCYAIRDRPFDRRYWLLLAGYWLLALALLYTHYTAFLALAAHGAYVGWRTLRPPSRRKVVILAHLGTGLALGYLPWILALAGRDVRAGTAYDDQITPW
ncbi:MAG: glycosyltransferase family 39 protein, partial [Anaerolineae bacterium]|nr:glycosyltransferase family 39 protein [Anaerolineae bacterium]